MRRILYIGIIVWGLWGAYLSYQREWVALGATFTWFLAGGLFFAILQVYEAKKGTNAQLAVQLSNELRSEETKNTLRFIYQLSSEDIQNANDANRHRIDGMLDKFELLGALVNQKIIDPRLAIEAFAGPPALRCWYQLVDYIRAEQKNRGFFLKNYEIFTRSTLNHFYDEKVEIWLTLKDKTRIPLVETFIDLRNREDIRCPRDSEGIEQGIDC
jgi:hypothetical protein